MSTYIDTAPRGEEPDLAEHSWSDFTSDRLTWLYGPNHVRERAVKTAADLAAWRSLGEPKGDAA